MDGNRARSGQGTDQPGEARHRLRRCPRRFRGLSYDVEDDREDYGEIRYVTLGRIGRQIVVCVWTPRGDRARLISLRKADKDEREIYNLYRP